MKTLFTILLSTIISSWSFCQVKHHPKLVTSNFTKYVDPTIGTGFHGHVFVGANVPFGAVQLGPTNISDGWDWSSGYHQSDSTIVGFQHTHLSGTGIGDLGDISLMPTNGPVIVQKGSLRLPQSKGYYSLFSHKNETVRPGYYQVKLKRYGIDVRLTASNRVGFHEYTFPASKESHVVIDLQSGIGWDRPTSTYVRMVNSTTIEGYRMSTGWAKDQRVYFTAIFSKPIQHFAAYDSTTLVKGLAATGTKVKGVVTFETKDGEKVAVKVGISPVSMANALLNVRTEIPGWDFNRVMLAADAAWNAELGKIKIHADSISQLRKFYTALYHTMIAPSTFNDVNGDYRGTDQKVYPKAKFQNLTTFSLWDTYRAAHPLFTLTQPKRVNDMINSMLAIYQQQGKLPVWHLMGNETNTMVGYSAVPVIVDAYLKGFEGFDAKLAYEAIRATTMRDDFGLKHVKALGFIPADTTLESVAMGLEYAIADWGAAQMAKQLGKTTDYNYYLKRGQNYKNYFDQETGFMRGRVSANAWRTPFNPFYSKHRQDDYAEGNAWQYTWLVPQDIPGLITLMGGKEQFIKKLDSLFVAKGYMGEEASNDISGLIGQYAHGNEPSHHITYLYTLAGQPSKTAAKVRDIMDNFYTDKPDGIIGNEDVGQMSAWFVLSAMGFYQVNPVDGKFVFGSPLFQQVVLQLAGDKKFVVRALNNSPAHRYIKRVTLNGKPYTANYIDYRNILRGGELVFEMTDRP